MGPLAYSDLYELSEELQKLKNAQLQDIQQPSLHRIVLEFRQPGESRLLILDLAPAKPFIVSTSFTKIKSLRTKTPIANFLRAHFLDQKLEALNCPKT